MVNSVRSPKPLYDLWESGSPPSLTTDALRVLLREGRRVRVRWMESQRLPFCGCRGRCAANCKASIHPITRPRLALNLPRRPCPAFHFRTYSIFRPLWINPAALQWTIVQQSTFSWTFFIPLPWSKPTRWLMAACPSRPSTPPRARSSISLCVPSAHDVEFPPE